MPLLSEIACLESNCEGNHTLPVVAVSAVLATVALVTVTVVLAVTVPLTRFMSTR